MRESLVLYTRNGCHLCEEAEAVLRRLGCMASLVDVDADPDLQSRYGDQVPVLAINGLPILSGIIREDSARAVLGR